MMEVVLDCIKNDWEICLPYKLRRNRYAGASRPAYVLICLFYYLIKDAILISVGLFCVVVKFVYYDMWVWLAAEIGRKRNK